MKYFKVIFCLMLIIISGILIAEEKFVIRFNNPDSDILSEFTYEKYDIASYKPNVYLDLVVTDEIYQDITARGYELEITQTESQLRENMVTGRDLEGYRTYDDILMELQQIETEYPNLCKLYDVGESRGKQYSDAGNSNYDDYYHDIWALKLSDNVELEEDEPNVYYMGEHHGNEPISLEVSMAILYHLLDNYGVDPTITDNVNNTQIWFVPLVNPNGHKVVTDETNLWWRKNICDNDENGLITPSYGTNYPDGVDLNRNYGFAWGYVGSSGNINSKYYHGLHEFSEPETFALKELLESHHFVTGISYHSYGELVLFPYAYCYGIITPDHEALEELAVEMAAPMGYTPMTIPQLYPCMGVLDDYSYGMFGTFTFTVELATQFIPPAAQIQGICDENIQSAMILLDRVNHSTLTGHITDAATGEPLQAEIFVDGVDNTGGFRLPYTSDEELGTYYRLLTDGNYDVTFSAYGYVSQTFEDIYINCEGQTILDLALSPETITIDVTGSVTNGDTGLPIENATVEIQGYNILPVNTNQNGEYIISGIFPYTYDLLVYANELLVSSDIFEVDQNNSIINFELFEPDDGTFETGEFGNGWEFTGNADWLIDDSTVYAGNYSAVSGNVSNNRYSEISVSIYNAEDDDISFYRKVSSEYNYDHLLFLIDGLECGVWSGNVNWGNETYPVQAGIHTFTWTYIKDISVSTGSDCAWIDNISFPGSGVFVENILISSKNKLHGNYPNPFNPTTTINYSLKENSKVSLNIYNIKGQKVKQLVSDQILAGQHSVVWNGKDDNNKSVSSGIYFYKLKTENYEKTKRMALLK